MGAIGKYGKRTIWRRLGATMKIRDRVYEVSGTDPVRIYIMGAELAALVGQAPDGAVADQPYPVNATARRLY
jgi:hypothetical protein